jgi:hypothetical protein
MRFNRNQQLGKSESPRNYRRSSDRQDDSRDIQLETAQALVNCSHTRANASLGNLSALCVHRRKKKKPLADGLFVGEWFRERVAKGTRTLDLQIHNLAF